MREGPRTLLIAEDDDDDFLLTAAAMEEAGVHAVIERVRDGDELLDYLLGRGRYAGAGRPAPGSLLVLLDLNMPKKDGREALREIKSNSLLRAIPVIVLTTSRADVDVARAYDLGVNSFMRKPSNFDEFVDYARALNTFWFKVSEMPAEGGIHGTR